MTQTIYETSSDEVVKYPPLKARSGSLTAFEKLLLGNLILLIRPRIIVELGVFEALSTGFMCELMSLNGIDGRVIGFDLPDVIAGLRQNNQAVQQYERAGQLEFIPGALPVSLRGWLADAKPVVDFALVDASHDYPSVIGELSLLWERLSPDGMIVCHDYSARYDGVRYAVDAFARRHKAMALPLTTTVPASEAGCHSVLIALRPPLHRTKFDQSLHHRWLKLKKDLLANPVIRHLWAQHLRRLVKGKGSESAKS